MSAPHCVAVAWPVPAGVRAAFTSRRGGVSRPPWDSLNLGLHVDDAANVQRNRQRVAAALALPAAPCWLTQEHGARVVRVEGAMPAAPVADAAITRVPGCVLAVLVADCLPVLLCDRDGTEVAVAHAGWRGLDAGVIARTVAAFRAPPPALLAWIGPAIGPRAYTVGAALRQRFIDADAGAASVFTLRAGNWHMDLAALARRQLAAAGVDAVSVSPQCVFEQGDLYFSYRRSGVTGRMAAFIWRT